MKQLTSWIHPMPCTEDYTPPCRNRVIELQLIGGIAAILDKGNGL